MLVLARLLSDDLRRKVLWGKGFAVAAESYAMRDKFRGWDLN